MEIDDKITYFGAGLIFGYIAQEIDWSNPLQVAVLSLSVFMANMALRAFWWYWGQR